MSLSSPRRQSASLFAATQPCRGRRVLWPVSSAEGLLAFAVGWAVWRLLDLILFPGGTHGNYSATGFFAWACPILANVCAFSAACLLRAVRGGTVRVSPAAYGAMAFPVLQTAVYFALTLTNSFGSESFDGWVTFLFIIALSLSFPTHLLLSAFASKQVCGTSSPKRNGLAILFCVAWYVFLLTLSCNMPS